MRKRIFLANWKENKTPEDAAAFIKGLASAGIPHGMDVVICPPYVCLPAASDAAKGSSISIGCQDVSRFESGAYTGEVSPLMLKGLCSYAIVGHSERRRLFHETDESVNAKVRLCIKHGILPVICVGETLDERKSGKTEDVVARQTEIALEGIDGVGFVIAYEPVWAISGGVAGTEPATPETAEAVHKAIRRILHGRYGKGAESVRIVYGGSVKPENIASFMAKPDVSGALVGNASLEVDSFLKILVH
jgi:triosephosphate isomerase (TIM)